MDKKNDNNKVLTPEQIAALFNAQSDTEVAEEQAATVVEPTPNPEPEVPSNGMLTAEQIAALFDAQSDAEVIEEQADAVEEQVSVHEEDIAAEPAPIKAPEATSNGMLTAEQIAALFDAQSDAEVVEVQADAVDEQVSVHEEALAAETAPKIETEASSNGMLTAEQIAALFDAQSDAEVVEEQAATAIEEEIIIDEEASNAEPAPMTEPEASSNGMLTAEQIAALFDAQSDTEVAKEHTDAVEEQVSTHEEAIATEPASKIEPEAPSNGMLTAEQIAALFNAQSEEEQAAAVVEPTPNSEPEAPSNGMLTAEQIAALFDAQSDAEVAEVQADTVEEQVTVHEEAIATEPAPKIESEAPSNGMLTAEQIAALFDTQSDTEVAEEKVDTVEEQVSVHEEAIAAETAPKIEPETPSNGMLTAEQIAALFDAQSDTEVAEEQADAVVEEETIINEEVSNTEPAPKTEEEAPSNGMLSAEEQASVIEMETSNDEEINATEPVSVPKPEPDASSDGMLTAEQNSALFEAQSETPSESMLTTEQIADLPDSQNDIAFDEQITTEEDQVSASQEPIDTVPVPDPHDESEVPAEDKLIAEQSTSLDSDKSTSKVNSSIVKRIIASFNMMISYLKQLKITKKESDKKPTELTNSDVQLQSEKEDPQADKSEYTNDSADMLVNALPDEAEKDEVVLDVPETLEKKKKVRKPKLPKQPKTKSKNSGLKVAMTILAVSVLMSSSFMAGYFSRDYITLFKPDPAKIAEKAKLAEEKAKEAEKAKRLEVLAAIDPKEYTSSMYLESLILKGQAANKTSIKLNKIDDVSLLAQFPKLRRIRLYNMTGNEDLSVIQKLTGVEEILIESSVLKNQFAKGSFDSVTYIELTDCKVENSNQFANFKKTVEFYADTTKFVTKDGKLGITAYLPSLETLTLSNCGDYTELLGVQNLKNLKKLKLSDNTIVKNTSYVQNPQIESVTVDISFVTNSEQLTAFSSLQKLSSLTLEVGNTKLSETDLNTFVDWISSQHPDATVKISTY